MLIVSDNDNDGKTDEDCYDRVRCRETRMEIDDRIDNDCDGEIDEELCDDDIGLYLIANNYQFINFVLQCSNQINNTWECY